MLVAVLFLSSIWHLGADGWTAIATWVGALVAVTVGLGAFTVGRDQVSEARRLRREQAQPYVVVFTDGSGNDPRHLDLVIKNFGMTAATEVRVSFSAPLESAVLRDTPGLSPIKTPDLIPVLVPGQEWRTFWDFTAARAGVSDLPKQYTATVTFNDSRGAPVGALYEFVIDWGVLQDRGFVGVRNLHDAARSLDEISQVLKKAGSAEGIAVVTRDGDAMDERNRKFYEEQQRRHEP